MYRFRYEAIREGREKKDYRPEAFAVANDVSVATVRNWETGRNAPSIPRLLHAAELLDLDPADLFEAVES